MIALSSKPLAQEQNIWTGRAPLRLGFFVRAFQVCDGSGWHCLLHSGKVTEAQSEQLLCLHGSFSPKGAHTQNAKMEMGTLEPDSALPALN